MEIICGFFFSQYRILRQRSFHSIHLKICVLYIDTDTKLNGTTPLVTKIIPGPTPDSESDMVMSMMLPPDTWDNPIAPTDPTVTIQDIPATDIYVR